MKLRRSSLIEALKYARKFTARSSEVPAVQNVLIDGENKRIVATDFEATITIPISIVKPDAPDLGGITPLTEDEFRGELGELTLKQLTGMAEDYGVEVGSKRPKKNDIVGAFIAAAEPADTAEMPDMPSFLINPADLVKVLERLEEEHVEIDFKAGSDNIISVGENFHELYVMPAGDFPSVIGIMGNLTEVMKLDPGTLRIMGGIKPEPGEKRTHINNVMLYLGHGQMHSTDIKRLASAEIPKIDWFDENKAVGIPKSLIGKLPAHNSITLHLDDRGNIRLETIYPNASIDIVDATITGVPHSMWQGILDTSLSHCIEVAMTDLKQVCDKVAPVLNNEYRGAIFKFNGKLQIHATNPCFGVFDDEIELTRKTSAENEEQEIALRPGFVLYAIKNGSAGAFGKKVEIQYQDADNMIRILPEESKVQHVVMPMRI